MALSHFDEKSGIVPCRTDWGQWWQNIDEIHVEITSFTNLKSKDVVVNITPNSLRCVCKSQIVLEVITNQS